MLPMRPALAAAAFVATKQPLVHLSPNPSPVRLALFGASGKKAMGSSSTQEPSPSSVDHGWGDRALADATDKLSNLDLSRLEKFARKRGDALFGYIEQCQVDACDGEVASFGDFLDAGTGSHSLRWMASMVHRDRLLDAVSDKSTEVTAPDLAPRVSMTSFSAVTADETMRRRVYDEAKELGVEDRGEIIIGNWREGVQPNGEGGIDFASDNGSKALLEGRQFDTILADYLVGAIDGFSPYFQDLTFQRLVHHLKPGGGRMYIIGLQPIPDKVAGDADVFCKITKIRDACILLANHRCYREYPLDWIERHVSRAGLTLVGSRKYPIRYDHATMLRQINVGRSKLKLFPSQGMAKEMGKVLDELERESLEVTKRQESGRITLGFDYVVVAERPK